MKQNLHVIDLATKYFATISK